MSGRSHNMYAYVLYKLGALTVTISEDPCNACGRASQSLRYSVSLGRRRAGGAIVICQPCMKEISEDHAEYLNLRPRKPS